MRDDSTWLNILVVIAIIVLVVGVLELDLVRRLLAGVHRCGQDALPLACVIAGLPNLVGLAAKAVTYAERMFAVDELARAGDRLFGERRFSAAATR